MDHQSFTPYFRHMDTFWQAALARFTLGISPAGAGGAYLSWLSHLCQAPGKIAEIGLHPILHAPHFAHRMTCERSESCAADPRFKSSSWDAWPWRLYAESFLHTEDWWREATSDIPGLDAHQERIMSFAARQMLDALCPANFPATNPDLAYTTLCSGGQNLMRGAQNALQDLQNIFAEKPADEKFKVGIDVAVTPGDIVFRNDLIELICYRPQTDHVFKEPVLILPAWIMKYYILDLSPHNSLVRWLVSQGHTVYMVSWKNPKTEDRNLSMDDYYRLGALAAIDAISKSAPQKKIHLAGYCLGGTLALITAAAMARKSDARLKSLTLFAAQGDFTEAGELELFVSYSEVAFLKNMMEVQGYLDTRQMAGAFQMLRSYDLIWSKIISDYLEGKRRDTYDLTAWNADATRMPCRMHGEYLEKLFLHNDLAEGRFRVEGAPVSTKDIRIPIFALGAFKDHIAPWHSVYKIHQMASGPVTFVLTTGGHNAGIVSEPGHPGRFYHLAEKKPDDMHLDPEEWLAQARKEEGSWWEAWHAWLSRKSSPEKAAPVPPLKSLDRAPGTYVLQK